MDESRGETETVTTPDPGITTRRSGGRSGVAVDREGLDEALLVRSG